MAIIGAGLIGCEFTNDLLNGGFTVEAVDPMGWCLPTLLPEQSGRAVQAALEDKGATFHFGPLATEVNRVGEYVLEKVVEAQQQKQMERGAADEAAGSEEVRSRRFLRERGRLARRTPIGLLGEGVRY